LPGVILHLIAGKFADSSAELRSRSRALKLESFRSDAKERIHRIKS
jgi:hypothetical protein